MEVFKYYVSKLYLIIDPNPQCAEGELLDDLFDKFQIIKRCFSIIIRNVFWGIGAVFKKIRAW